MFLSICILVSLLLQTSHSFVVSPTRLRPVHSLRDQIASIDDCATCAKAPKCSGEYLTKGCDGTGKIQGGIATVPLLSWWPIKVFRPCPSYLAAGYVYRREGQTMDQVLFSEPSTKMKEKMDEIRKKDAEEKELNSRKVEVFDEAVLSDEEKFLRDKFGGKQ